ncbi:hypothetical protein Pvag_0020 [Pantoea vagans C9-1]|nr:hypothetical protein Pvag_0020 [Pantoea vagans C9-1]
MSALAAIFQNKDEVSSAGNPGVRQQNPMKGF